MHIQIPTPPDFSFHETVHSHGWRALAPFVWDEPTQALTRVEAFGKIVTALTITGIDGAVAVESSAIVDENDLVGRVSRMLQLDIDIAPFHDYCHTRPQLSHVPHERKGRMLRSPSVFEDVVKVIATTNTTWTQTTAMVQRMVGAYGSPLPGLASRSTAVEGADVHLARAFPTPSQIAAVAFDEFASAAKLGYRNAAVHSLATDIAECRIDLEELRDPGLASDALWKRLLALRGVGPYAAACLMLYLGRGDKVNVDSWARTLLARELGRPVTDREVYAYFEDHGNWQGLAYQFWRWEHERPDGARASSDLPEA